MDDACWRLLHDAMKTLDCFAHEFFWGTGAYFDAGHEDASSTVSRGTNAPSAFVTQTWKK